MLENIDLKTYYDEDVLPEGQEPIDTNGVQLVRGLVEKLLNSGSRTRHSIIALVVGESGLGKSIALKTVLDEVMSYTLVGLPTCLIIKAKPNSSPRQLLEDICHGCGEKPRRPNMTSFKLTDEASQLIFYNNIRLIGVDNANHLNAACYAFLCEVFGQTGCPIIVVGLPPIHHVIQDQEQFMQRTYVKLPFPPPSDEEVLHTILPQLTIPYWTFDPNSEEDRALGNMLWNTAKPSFRNLRNIIQFGSMFFEDLTEDQKKQRNGRITRDLLEEGFQLSYLKKSAKRSSENREGQEAQEGAKQGEYEKRSVARQSAKNKNKEEV